MTKINMGYSTFTILNDLQVLKRIRLIDKFIDLGENYSYLNNFK